VDLSIFKPLARSTGCEPVLPVVPSHEVMALPEEQTVLLVSRGVLRLESARRNQAVRKAVPLADWSRERSCARPYYHGHNHRCTTAPCRG